MHFHSLDPAFTHSPQAHANSRLAIKLVLGFVALLWLIPLLGWGLDLQQFGVRPHQPVGLLGIVFAPLLHANLAHLIANTVPVAVLGIVMLHLYPTGSFRVLPAIYFGPGIAVWLFARDGNHVGASGLVYGLVAYIFVAGLIRRDRRAIGASLLVAFLYGTLVWGLFPLEPGVSWETHLAAAVIGIVMAVLLRDTDLPPRVEYSWEREPAEIDGEFVELSDPPPTPPQRLEQPRVLH